MKTESSAKKVKTTYKKLLYAQKKKDRKTRFVCEKYQKHVIHRTYGLYLQEMYRIKYKFSTSTR